MSEHEPEQDYFAEPNDDDYEDSPFLPEFFRPKTLAEMLPDDMVRVCSSCLYSDGENVFIDPECEFFVAEVVESIEPRDPEDRREGLPSTIVISRSQGEECPTVTVMKTQFIDEEGELDEGYLVDARNLAPGDIPIINPDITELDDELADIRERCVPVTGIIYLGETEKPEYVSRWYRENTVKAAQALAEAVDTFAELMSEPDIVLEPEDTQLPEGKSSKKVVNVLRKFARHALPKPH